MTRVDIQHIGSNKFIVGLTKTDMEQLDITYEAMDYSNIETRRVIWTILDRVRQHTGKDVDPSGNLVIEAAPDSTGGCFLMFTVPASQKHIGAVISKSNSTCVFEFENADNLLDMLAASHLEKENKRCFTDGKKYRLELPTEKAVYCRRIIEEYGKFIGKDCVTAAATHEHWKELKGSTPES